jgi:hypothetical protein
MKDTDHSFSPALMAYEAMQELLIAITDGYNTSPFPDGSVKAGAVEDALSTMLYIHQTLHQDEVEAMRWYRLSADNEL